MVDPSPGAGGLGGVADDGRAVVEAHPVAGGHDVGNEPTQGGVLVIGRGLNADGAIPGVEGPWSAPVLQAVTGDGEHRSADGIGEDVGLDGQVSGAAAVLEAPLQPLVAGAVGANGHGRGEDNRLAGAALGH